MASAGFFLPIALWIQRGLFGSIPPGLAVRAMADHVARFPAVLHSGLPLAAAISASLWICRAAAAEPR